jgi:hypothetical protein
VTGPEAGAAGVPGPPKDGARRRLATACSLAVAAAAFAHALVPSWRKWGSLYVDVGRELELPRQLLEGARLYQDVRAYYGPLAYWVNEGLYALFGVHADVLAGAGLVTAALYAGLAWLLGRALLGPAGAALLAATVAEVNLFPHLFYNPSFNFVLPYAFPATYGALLLLASTLGLVRHAQEGRPAPFAAAAAALGLVALTKVELLAAALAAHAAFALATGPRRLGRLHLAGWALALGLPAAVYLGLWAQVGDALWTDSLGANFAGNAAVFFRRMAGLEDVPASIVAMGGSAAALLATAALAAGAAWLARRPGLPPAAAKGVAALALAGAALGWSRLDFQEALRALPAALLAALAATAWRAWRAPEARAALVPDLVLLAAGLASLGRLGLAVGPQHYGFYLLPLGLLAFGVVALGRLPALLSPAGPGRVAAAAAAAGLLLGLAWPVVEASRATYRLHTATLDTPRGRFLVIPDEALTLVPLLAELPPGTRTITVPSGAGWVFAAGQPWGDGTHSYLPLDLVGGYDDAHTVSRWSTRPPQVIVWLHGRLGDAAEFGAGPIGTDHGRAITRFVDARYEVLVPARPGAFYTVLQLRR